MNTPPNCSLDHYSSDPALIRTDLASRYDIIDEEIKIGVCSFSMLRIRDTNALLEALPPSTFAVDERLPYWAELWPSSVELARHCLEECNLEGKTVLELGCGLGLAGIAAAAAGAHVTFTDYEPDALLFARYNALRNLPQTALQSRTEFRLLDWRSDEQLEPVDMIIGADIVYERRNFLPILKLIRRVVKHDGCALFTDPDRTTGMSFFAHAEREGFGVSMTSREVPGANRARTILLGHMQLESVH